MAAFLPSPFSIFPFYSSSSSKALRPPTHIISTSAVLGLNRLLKSPRDRLCLLVCSSFQENILHSPNFSKFAEDLCGNLLKGCSKLESLAVACLSTQTSGLDFFNGKDLKRSSNNKGQNYETSPRNYSDGRLWTNLLLAINVLVYIAQVATHGKLLLWGAKVNNLINDGQIWRLVTSSFLHADIAHLMVNSYSLNSVGPTVEQICGPRRFLSIYLGSAVASSAMSYCLCESPAVGASGAIFGLVGASALFIMRHRRFIGSGKQELLEIFKVIAINMVIGLSVRSIDNWGHLGGLLGGAAISWFVGPLWRYETRTEDGKPVLADKAPIFNLIDRKKS